MGKEDTVVGRTGHAKCSFIALSVLLAIMVLLLALMSSSTELEEAFLSKDFVIACVILNILTFISIGAARAFSGTAMFVTAFIIFLVTTYATTLTIGAHLSTKGTLMAFSVALITSVVLVVINIDTHRKVPLVPLSVGAIGIVVAAILNALVVHASWARLLATTAAAMFVVIFVSIEIAKYVRTGHCANKGVDCCMSLVLKLFRGVTDPEHILDTFCEVRRPHPKMKM